MKDNTLASVRRELLIRELVKELFPNVRLDSQNGELGAFGGAEHLDRWIWTKMDSANLVVLADWMKAGLEEIGERYRERRATEE